MSVPERTRETCALANMRYTRRRPRRSRAAAGAGERER